MSNTIHVELTASQWLTVAEGLTELSEEAARNKDVGKLESLMLPMTKITETVREYIDFASMDEPAQTAFLKEQARKGAEEELASLRKEEPAKYDEYMKKVKSRGTPKAFQELLDKVAFNDK